MIPPTTPSPNFTGVGAPFTGLPLGATPCAPATGEPECFGPDHVTAEMHADAIAAIDLGKTTSSNPALQSALNKMKGGVELLLSLGLDALSDAALRALWHKNNESDDAATRSRDKIHAHFDRLEAQNKERLHQVHQRAEARGSASFWEKLAGIFETIASVVGAVAAVATGGMVGLVAAACMLGSMAMSAAGANEWATLGVGFGGAILGGFTKAAGEGLKAIAQQIGKYVSLALRTAEALSNYQASEKNGDALDADAELQQLRNERQQLLGEADKEREAIESLRQASHRAALTVIETLSSNHRTKLAALGA